MVTPKEQNNFLVTVYKEMEMEDLLDKEFKIKPVNIHREIRENMKNMKQEASEKNQLEIWDVVAV